MTSAERGAAGYQAAEAMREAEVGNGERARRDPIGALKLA